MLKQNLTTKDLFEKNTDKGKFYFIKTNAKSFSVEDLLKEILPKTLASISWKKSMKWSHYDLIWGRPLRSILALFNSKKLIFKFDHLETTDRIIVQQDLTMKSSKIKNFKNYITFLKNNKILLDHNERERLIINRII